MREAGKVCVHSDVGLLKERWAERQRLTAERDKLIAELEAVLEPELGTQAMRKATGLVMQRMADRTARRVSLVHGHQVTPAAISGYAPNSLGAFFRCMCNCRCPTPLCAQIDPLPVRSQPRLQACR